MRTHRFLVPSLIAVATIVWFAAAFSVWVNRQALNTDNWTKTSGKLLASKKVDTALGAYLVNQLFTNVDVQGALQQRLPAQLQGLAVRKRRREEHAMARDGQQAGAEVRGEPLGAGRFFGEVLMRCRAPAGCTPRRMQAARAPRYLRACRQRIPQKWTAPSTAKRRSLVNS